MDHVRVERDVLGCILLANSVWEQASSLCERDFSLEAHQRIFRRIYDLAESTRPIDEATVAEELSRHGELDLVGGAVYVASLTDGAVERKDITYLSATLKDHTTRISIKIKNIKQKRETASYLTYLCRRNAVITRPFSRDSPRQQKANPRKSRA